MDEKKNMRADVLGRRDALDAQTRAHKSATICRALERLVEEDCAPDAGARSMLARRNSAEADRLGPAYGVRAYRNLGRPPCVAVRRHAQRGGPVGVAESAFARGWDVCFPHGARRGGRAGAGRMAFYRVPGARLDHARAAFLDHPLRCRPCAALADAGYEEAAPADLDAVAVPLVAFDDEGNRLGYGGGTTPVLPAPRRRARRGWPSRSGPACEPHDRPSRASSTPGWARRWAYGNGRAPRSRRTARRKQARGRARWSFGPVPDLFSTSTAATSIRRRARSTGCP
ncbi:MAG: 5-formyltetrahydrofolate cyclo-ligase [Eggerthella lenta]